MTKTRLILFFYLFVNQLFAQTEFAEVGTVWQYGYTTGIGQEFTIRAESVKDTLIKGLSFKKLNTAQLGKPFCSTYPNCALTISYGYGTHFFRQSNDSLFEYRQGNINYFFNYKLKIGDTLTSSNRRSRFGLPNKYIVRRLVDTLVGSKKLRKWSVSQLCESDALYKNPIYEFVEGIGSPDGFISIEADRCNIDPSGYGLFCFKNSFVNSQAECQLVSTKYLNSDDNLTISPNPAQHSFSIISNSKPIKTIRFFDLHGRLVKSLINQYSGQVLRPTLFCN